MSYNSTSSKRAAEDHARTTHGQEDLYGQPTKKPRFDVRNPSALAPDELEDDAVLEADVIGGRGQQVRRGAVNIDGYDSDSDNDNFDARADAKVKEQKMQSPRRKKTMTCLRIWRKTSMMAMNRKAMRGRRRGKKKAVQFLNVDQIVGQVENSTSGGHVSADFSLNSTKGKGRVLDKEVESSSDSEVDDETRANADELDPELGAGSKKTHAPKLDAFNMKSEMEEGGFDDQENYVRKAIDPDAKHDVWLEGTSKKEIKRAKEAAEKREVERRQRALEDDSLSTGTVLSTLIPLLERGETILEALARLGKRKDKKPKWQNKNKNIKNKGTAEDDAPGQDDVAEQARRQKVEDITGAADILMTRGQAEIYDVERELLVRQYRKETGEDWVEPVEQDDHEQTTSMEQLWEYRWTDARDGGAINGPYDANTMQQWNDAGYFGEGVEFRRKDDGDWTRVAAFA